MMKNVSILGILLASVLALAIAPITEDIFAEKKDKTKPIKCQVKVQVKLINAVNGTIYTAQLENLQAQSKQATEPTVAFNFQFKKGGEACPEKASTVEGNINGEAFSGVINSLTKPNKVAVELAGTS